MKHIIQIIITILLPISICAQLQIDWQQCYCSTEDDIPHGICETSGGFLVLGFQDGDDGQVTCTNGGATWLIKIDYDGNLIWQECYTDIGGMNLYKSLTDSGRYFICGGCGLEPYSDVRSLGIGIIDSTGVFLWKKAYGNENGITGYGEYGTPTNDGGFIGATMIFSQGGDITNWFGSLDGWLVKVDSLGNKEWDFTMGSANQDHMYGVIQTNDNGYLALLSSASDGVSGNIECNTGSPTQFDAVVFKVDSVGNSEWHKCFGGTGTDTFNNAISLDDGYLICGNTSSNDGDLTGSGWHGEKDIWLIRTDIFGNVLWQRCYGGTKREWPKKLFQTSDGGFIIFGDTESNNGDVSGNPSYSSRTSIWIFKIDSIGNLEWQQCIGSHAIENVYSVVQHDDYKYTLAGRMSFSPSFDVDCSNFIYGSDFNYWVLGISDTTVNTTEHRIDNNDITIYPVPAENTLNVELPANFDFQDIMIEIIDIKGTAVLYLQADKLNTHIDIKDIVPGLYVLKIQNDKTIITKRFIKQKMY